MTGIRDLFTERRRTRRENPPAIIEILENRALLATVTVDVGGATNTFSPSTITIHQGDTVDWVWQGGFHNVVSVAGIAEQFNSGAPTGVVGNTFDHTFTHVGTFAYYCAVHGSDNGNGTAGGMSGTVTVLASTPTPTPTTPSPTPTTPSPTPTTPSPTPTTPNPTPSPLVATGVNGKGKVNKTFHKQVARFSEAGAKPTSFTVSIDWGDQSPPTGGQVRKMGKKGFSLIGSHRYLTTGVFMVMATIRDQSGHETDTMSMVTVTGKVKAVRH
jgi:plastocyanin